MAEKKAKKADPQKGKQQKAAGSGKAEKVKETIREAAGFPKMKKGASLWDWFKTGVVFLFAQDKGREMMRGALGEESASLTSGFSRVFFKRLSREDENLYLLAKKWFDSDEREILGNFEWDLKSSKWDFEGFKDQIGQLNKVYADKHPVDSKDPDKKEENPAYSILKKIIDARRSGKTFKEQCTLCGPGLIQEELGEKIGIKDFGKNPWAMWPAKIVFGVFFAFVAFFIVGTFVVLI